MSDPWKADEPIREENFINESERDSVNPENDEYKVVKLESDGKISSEFVRKQIRRVYEVTDSPATWNKPANLKFVKVEMWGGGGGGGRTESGDSRAGGGGGGAYNVKRIEASELNATETVTVGAGGFAGALNSFGGDGGTSSFGSHVLAYGGGRGGGATFVGGERYGGGGGGQLSVGGGGSQNATPGSPGYPSAGYGSPAGNELETLSLILKNGTMGGGGGTNRTESGGNSIYGGGGGGGGNGGVSVHGGNGGSGSSTAAGDGAVPGGGGGAGRNSGTSGAGGAGRVIVTEYFI